MTRYLCKICGRLAGQAAENCNECEEPLFCNLCGYDTDLKLNGKRELLRIEHRKEEHVPVDLI